MFIKFDKHELLEVFESEPIEPTGKGTGQFIYTKQDQREISLTMAISIYEMKCDICLTMKDRLIFETAIEQVESLMVKDRCLRIRLCEDVCEYMIYFGPNIFIKTINKG